MISYFGGKSRMAEWIYEYIPKDVKTYAEVFSGAFWVYLNPKVNYEHISYIRYNDYNRHITNLYACCQDYQKMIKTLETSLNSGFLHSTSKDPDLYKQFYKDLYYDFKNNPQNTFLDDTNFTIPDYEVAEKYAFLITSAFNGCWPKAAGFSGVNNGKLKLYSLINKLKDKKYQRKFDRISSFDTLDFQEFIEKYDAEDTFLYLDPPYFSEDDRRANWYGVKSTFGYEAHERLSKVLANTKSRWALSYYDYPELSQWYPKDKFYWMNKEFFRSSASFSDSKEDKGNELLIFNYNPADIKEIVFTEDETKPLETPEIETPEIQPKVENEIDPFWL
jgi:DNA adenine methylase